jgi:hypothetical protein
MLGLILIILDWFSSLANNRYVRVLSPLNLPTVYAVWENLLFSAHNLKNASAFELQVDVSFSMVNSEGAKIIPGTILKRRIYSSTNDGIRGSSGFSSKSHPQRRRRQRTSMSIPG